LIKKYENTVNNFKKAVDYSYNNNKTKKENNESYQLASKSMSLWYHYDELTSQELVDANNAIYFFKHWKPGSSNEEVKDIESKALPDTVKYSIRAMEDNISYYKKLDTIKSRLKK